MKHLYLIGFMGSGKSTIGKMLSPSLQLPFEDLDHSIETTYGTSIPSLIENQGEGSFRNKETQELKGIATSPPKVIATGGGTPCYDANLEFMNQTGTTIYLKVPPEELINRLEKERDHRPLLQEHENWKEGLRERLEARKPFYEKAHHSIDASGKPQEVVVKILEQLRVQSR